MPKIPTFTAQGSIEQLQGSTATPQVKLTSTLANALAPVTKMVVDQQIQETNAQNQAEALKQLVDALYIITYGKHIRHETTVESKNIASDSKLLLSI